jgi:lambda family phage portal protein
MAGDRQALLAGASRGAVAGGAWDPTGTLPGLPGGSAFYRDAAHSGGRRAGPFNVTFRLTSPKTEIIRERRKAVVNAREVDRNNAMISAGITKRAVDMVGANLALQSLPNHEALGQTEEWAANFANRWENLFSTWGQDPRKLNDAERHSQFGAQMLEVCRNTYGADGEACIIIRYDEARRRRLRGKFATFVEVVDPDRVSNRDGRPDSETLCQGRVLDEYGAYTALHVAKYHPSDVQKGVQSWATVPRETKRGRPVGVHWFPRYRAGAQRAMPAIIGALREVRMLDTFDQKTLEAAIKQAFMSVVIRTDSTTAEALAKIQGSPTGGDAAAVFAQQQDARFALYEDFNAEGQAIPMMATGDYIDIAEAKAAGVDTGSFRFAFDRKFASLLRLSYARFSNDYSKTSFASIRAELIDAWRLTFADRYMFCNSVPNLVALAHLEDCYVNGMLDDVMPVGPNAPYFYDHLTEYSACEFRGPTMGWVDPVKDATASGMRVAMGQSSPQQEAAAAGGDYYDNINQTARAQAYAKRKLGYEIDFSATGAAMAEEPEEDPEAIARREEEQRENEPEPDAQPAPAQQEP